MDLIKNVFIFQVGGSTLAPPTPLVIRVVLLLKWHFVQLYMRELKLVFQIGKLGKFIY